MHVDCAYTLNCKTTSV